MKIGLILLLASSAVGFMMRQLRGFKMPEFEKLDPTKYNYDDISIVDVWQSKIVEKVGCITLNTTYYTDNILKAPEVDWLVTILNPGSADQDIEDTFKFST